MIGVYLAAAFAAGVAVGIEVAYRMLRRARRGGMVELDTPAVRDRMGRSAGSGRSPW